MPCFGCGRVFVVGGDSPLGRLIRRVTSLASDITRAELGETNKELRVLFDSTVVTRDHN